LGDAHIRYVIDDQPAHILLPRVHRVFSLVKRWLLATHQGAVSRKHLNAHLEEYTFRLNRRTAMSVGHGFQRRTEGCVRELCRPYWQIVGRISQGVDAPAERVLLAWRYSRFHASRTFAVT
jgi:hypothetical protein